MEVSLGRMLVCSSLSDQFGQWRLTCCLLQRLVGLPKNEGLYVAMSFFVKGWKAYQGSTPSLNFAKPSKATQLLVAA